MSRRAVAWAAVWFVVGLAMVGGALAIQHRVQHTVAAQFRSGQLVQGTVVARTGRDPTQYKVIFVMPDGAARQVTLVPSGANPQLPVGAEIRVAISRQDPALVVGDGQLTSQHSLVRLSELMGLVGVIVLALSVVLPVGGTFSRDPARPRLPRDHDRVEFDIVARGYDPTHVDALVALALAAARSNDPSVRADAAEELRSAAPAVRRRGFHRGQVEQFIARMQATLQEQRL